MSPYINKAHRPAYGAVLDALPDEFTATWPGDVAYLLTQILLRYVGDTAVGYSSHAMVLGILESVKLAQKGYIILCAGKGHEDYQEIKGVKHHFDDMEEFRKIYDSMS